MHIKHLAAPILFILSMQVCLGQDSWYDSILQQKSLPNSDTSMIHVWIELGNYHKFSRADSSIYYSSKALELSRSIKFLPGELRALDNLALANGTLGNINRAIKINREILRLTQGFKDPYYRALSLSLLGNNYSEIKNYREALKFYLESQSVSRSIPGLLFITAINSSAIGATYFRLGQQDSAFFYCYRAIRMARTMTEQSHLRKFSYELAVLPLANLHRDLGHVDSAFYYFNESLRISRGNRIQSYYTSRTILEMAKLFEATNRMDSCLFYANDALRIATRDRLHKEAVAANLYLSHLYERRDPAKALQFCNMAIAHKDTLANMSRMAGFSDLNDFEDQQRTYELKIARNEFKSKIRTSIFLGSTATLLAISFLIYRGSRSRQKARQKVEEAYTDLKATQNQLIQSEKMASLGELTAGIAHEIQNPLNFVNNFSEVNTELIDELEHEIVKGNLEEAKLLAKDIKENEQKINHHGKRAGDIVRGMLQHSRSSSGMKEPTDINALADEYLRLAYHGLRAKDKSFNATMKTDFDETIGNINIVPQDIGRVILNLITNAFYAVTEKKKQHIDSYEPTVSIFTRKTGDKVLITVRDNGSGIPQKTLDKIFQPFFTTKPTGQGTGLGLSLSYDIVKAHDGELKVETREGESAEFIITLPIV